MDNNFSYFQNKDCAFFPCHDCDSEFFNCLFCYCPLYALGDKCGGAFRYLEDGTKDCAGCLFPHRKENYGKILARYADIAELAKKK